MQSLENHKIISIDKNSEISNIIKKINLIEKELNNIYFEREDVIKSMITTVVSSQNMFLIGLPGTAKSELINEFSSRIEGCQYFSWLFNKTTDPSEIFGTFSIKQMENDKFIRITKGKMPEANIIFTDEIYKANEPVLNAMLTLMNERVFYNDGIPVKTPTISIFGASNEEPDSESLSALHDRFVIKMKVDYIKDPNNKLKMLTNNNTNKSKTTITMNELITLQQEVENIKIPKDILYKLILIVDELVQKDVTVSDRRLKNSIKILKSYALLKNKREVSQLDFGILLYVFSDGVNNIEIVKEVLKSSVKSFEEEFSKLKSSFIDIKEKIQQLNGRDKMEYVLNSKIAFKKIVEDGNNLYKLADNDTQRTNLDNLAKEVESFSKLIVQELLDF